MTLFASGLLHTHNASLQSTDGNIQNSCTYYMFFIFHHTSSLHCVFSKIPDPFQSSSLFLMLGYRIMSTHAVWKKWIKEVASLPVFLYHYPWTFNVMIVSTENTYQFKYTDESVIVEYGMSDLYTVMPWYQCWHTFTVETDSWAMMIVTTFPLVSPNNSRQESSSFWWKAKMKADYLHIGQFSKIVLFDLKTG